MAMSIRNSEVERLARNISSKIGCNLTETIEQALVSMQDKLAATATDRYDRIKGIADTFSRLPDLEILSEDELLGYGELGM